MLFIEKSKKRYLRSFKIFNFFIIPLYKLRVLPLFGIGRRLLILTTIGRKSGKNRNNPLEYFRINNEIHIFSGFGNKSDWFRNIKANPNSVYVQVGFKKFLAKIEHIEGSEVDAIFKLLARDHPKYFKAGFGWDPDNDNHETADFSSLQNLVKVIKIKKSLANESA
jgi:deazaflavin-dependent oxidoreductase (nitroreductase family)